MSEENMPEIILNIDALPLTRCARYFHAASVRIHMCVLYVPQPLSVKGV